MKKKMILYFTLGYPDSETLQNLTERINPENVDYVEFGFPSRNPVYDGPAIKQTHKSALQNYNREESERIFNMLHERGVKIYSLTYLKDVEDNFSEFLGYLKGKGFSGIIIPDLLVDFQERVPEIIQSIGEADLQFIPFFNPSTPDRVIEDISRLTDSWIYYGLMPSTGVNVPFDAEEVAERIHEILPGREINFGFGIRNEQQVRELMRYGASGIAIGTALIDFLDRQDPDSFTSFISRIRGVLNGN